jgi:glutathione S-transferase
MSAAASDPSSLPPVTVAYWSIRGLAAPLRMMVMYSGRRLNNVMYNVTEKDGAFDRSEWTDAKPALKERNALMNLPYVMDGEGRVVTQSNACLSYLGRRLGLWGDNEDDVVQCEEYLCELMDVRNATVGFAYGGAGAGDTETAVKFIANLTSPTSSFAKINLQHANNCKTKDASQHGYLVGSHATAPDFHLWEMMHQAKVLAAHHAQPDPFTPEAGFAALHTWFQAFSADPRNAKYLQSDLGDGRGGKETIPFNQKMAKFGGSPFSAADPTNTGAGWKAGQEYSFNQYTGVY